MNEVIAGFTRRLPSGRKLWLNVHLWLGLTAGFVLALIGLTGALLTLSGPLSRLQTGDIFSFDGASPLHADVDQWIANAQRAYGDLGAVGFVVGPGFGPAGGNAAMLSAVDGRGQRWTVGINPVSGLPLGRYVIERTFVSIILKFHSRLATDGQWIIRGQTALAGLGVAMIASMATGLYLWWPRNRNWSAAFTLKRGAHGRRRLLDLHNLFVVYFYVPLLIVALTGVYLERPDWIDPVVSRLSAVRTLDPAALARTSDPASCQARTTPGQAVALALARFPSSKFVFIITPEDQREPYQVNLAPPNNVGDKGQTEVSVDRVCPVILASIDGEVRVAAETLKAAQSPLHGRLMLGRVGQVIVFLTGLLLPLSFVTGVLLWLDKRKSRKRVQ
jgi:uncharacterized iron-regulated membrane protein